MPAELETMFYYGDVPWHGLGTRVNEVLTAEDAISAAGLDWEVSSEDVYSWNRIDEDYEAIPNKKAVTRSDGKVLGIVSDRYIPVQNREAFSFFDGVTGSGEAKYHTAGSLREGKRIWILAKLNDSISIKGDAVDKYILLSNSHDGMSPLSMFFTPIRVVCSNTLAAAFRGASNSAIFSARHLYGISNKIEAAREILGITNNYYTNFSEQANYLAYKMLPAGEMPKLLAAAFGTSGAIRPEDVVQLSDFCSTRKENEMVKIERLFDGEGRGLNDLSIRHTKWAAYNAIVEYLDYSKKFTNDSIRLENAFFDASNVKTQAWEYLLKN